jgi:nucleotide-binding universal stress UspA family protein
MLRLKQILVPIDFSDRSRRALHYAVSLAGENSATITVLHVANDLHAWELQSDEFSSIAPAGRLWPADRVVAEASLELSHFLEPYREAIAKIPAVAKKITLGPIAREIASAAGELQSDLIVMSPRRNRTFAQILTGSITDRVTRLSPCPVLSVTDPLPSRPWQGKMTYIGFGWPRQRMAGI